MTVLRQEKNPLFRAIAIVLIVLLAAGVLSLGWWLYKPTKTLDHTEPESRFETPTYDSPSRFAEGRHPLFARLFSANSTPSG